jgi:hypothetical protein
MLIFVKRSAGFHAYSLGIKAAGKKGTFLLFYKQVETKVHFIEGDWRIFQEGHAPS